MAAVDTSEAFKYHWITWTYLGIKPPQNRYRILYIIYSIAINTIVTVLFPVTLVANLVFSESLRELCEGLSITITDVISNLKFLNVFLIRDDLLKVNDIVHKLDIRASDSDQVNILKSGVKTAHRAYFTFAILFTIGTLNIQTMLLLSLEKVLLYPAYFPLDWKNSDSQYLMVSSYQLFGLIVQAIQDLCNDSYPVAYLSVLCAHIRALSIRIQNLGNKSTQTLDENFNDLRECIKDHQIIYELYQIIQRAISTASFAQFICSGLVQCTSAVLIFYVSNDLSLLFNTAIFFFAVTLEILVLCYFGDQLRQTSDELTQAIYSCDWTNQSPEFKKSLLILLQRSQKENVILAGGLIPVSLPTFVQVIKSAYSLFAILHEIS